MAYARLGSVAGLIFFCGVCFYPALKRGRRARLIYPCHQRNPR